MHTCVCLCIYGECLYEFNSMSLFSCVYVVFYSLHTHSRTHRGTSTAAAEAAVKIKLVQIYLPLPLPVAQ